MDVTALVPVYNSQETVSELVGELRSVLEAAADDFEIILVDDGSLDGSWSVIVSEAQRFDDVRGYRLARNMGQASALLCGIREARMDAIVTIDDDLQQPPSQIPIMLQAIEQGADVVYGISARSRHSLGRNLATWLVKFALEHVFRVPRARQVTSFRAFRTSLRDEFDLTPPPMFSIDGLLAGATTRFEGVVVQHEGRMSGGSRYTFGKLANHTMNLIAGSSTSPLFFASVSGSALATVGVLLALAVVVSQVASVGSSWQWLLVAAWAFTSGLVLVSLGMVGSYLARLLRHASGPTLYTVVEQTGTDG